MYKYAAFWLNVFVFVMAGLVSGAYLLKEQRQIENKISLVRLETFKLPSLLASEFRPGIVEEEILRRIYMIILDEETVLGIFERKTPGLDKNLQVVRSTALEFVKIMRTTDLNLVSSARQELLESISAFLVGKSFVFKNKRLLLWWTISCLIYIFLVVYMYFYQRVPTEIGEPVFNIVDITLLSILVQHTGGMSTLIRYFLAVSVVSVAFDFKLGIKLNKREGLLRILPFAFAFLLEYFWATIDEFLNHTWSIMWYGFDLLVFATVGAITLCLLVIWEDKSVKVIQSHF